MYKEWPILEFPDLNRSILDLFTRTTSESVSSSLLFELDGAEGEKDSNFHPIRLNTEDQLRWCMQVLNHALSLSFATDREFETIRSAVRIYLRWLRALTDLPDSTIPTPLLDTPEKYFRTIIESLRYVFCRRELNSAEVISALVVDRQAKEIEKILDAIRSLTETASRKYQNEVWARSLTFLLNSSDLFFSEPMEFEELGLRVGGRLVDTLFELWFKAVLREELPSPTYWRTLTVLSQRWRHHVTVIESWARKILALTVLVCRRLYGEDYCKICIHDESVAALALLPTVEESCEVDLLYHCWFNVLSLFGSPARILSHDPNKNVPLHKGIPESASATIPLLELRSLPLCFFLAVTAIQRMIDIFYGDFRVPIEFKESEVLIRKWMMQTEMSLKNRPERPFFTESKEADDSLTANGRASCSSFVSGKDGKSDNKRHDKARAPTHGNKSESTSTSTTAYQDRNEQSASASLNTDRLSESSANKIGAKATEVFQLSAGNFLSANPLYPAYLTESHPKCERLLSLTMNWLLEAAMVGRNVNAKPFVGDVSDDVISGLSLHSIDLDDVPDAMNSVIERPPSEKRRSSSSSSMTGDPFAGDNISFSPSSDPLTIDGVSAGRAAALGALTRIICSKTTNEKLQTQQLASYFAALHHALVEKDRIVLCVIFFYGHSLFRSGLPAVEAVLPHYLFALDIVLIESSKLRLHPSISPVEMRRCCLKSLSSVVCWPTTFGMSKVPQLAESLNLKSSASTYLHMRIRIYKTLVFSIRNETDPTNLLMTIAMCTVLAEESCSFDLGLTEEQRQDMHKIVTHSNSNGQPEKGLCVSFVRGLVSAVCDRICRPEWAGEHAISFAAIDFLNALSHINPTVLFNNNDVSTGSLIVASLCRFIETQLMKPPPLHSKDLHSTVVAAYYSIAVWLTAAPMLAECEGVLNTVAEAVQLGVTGTKKVDQKAPDERKAAPASKRVLEAAEYVMYSLFSSVGRGPTWLLCDERRLLYLYGPSVIDTTRFQHYLVNGDTLLSFHEASHIITQSDGCPCVLYVRRSPMHSASVGIARLRPKPNGSRNVPPTPSSSVISDPGISRSVQAKSMSATQSLSSVPMESIQSAASFPSAINVTTTDIKPAIQQCAPPAHQFRSHLHKSAGSEPFTTMALGLQFNDPQDFWKAGCKLDTMIRQLESSSETYQIMEELKTIASKSVRQEHNIWNEIPILDRVAGPKISDSTCDSIRVLMHDMGLVERETFGISIMPLDSGQSSDFYRDLHDLVDSCPARSLQTAHIFYVKEGQRSAIDILDNALNIQNTCADFCAFLSGLGEGIYVAAHDSWTGHWSTAYSSDRKPFEEPEQLDHYILDGVSHAIWWTDGTHELAFLMPTERSIRMFKQDLISTTANSRRGSGYKNSNISMSSDDIVRENLSFDSQYSETFLQPPGRSRGGSNLGSDYSVPHSSTPPTGSPPSRRSGDLKVMIVWLERQEDLNHFPIEELLCCCDDGSDKPPITRGERISFSVLFLYQLEQGLILVRSRGTPNRFGEAGPLCDMMVVSLASLPVFIHLTLLNIARRNVAEVENYQFTHARRKQAIADFSKKYASTLTYEDFVKHLIH